MDWARRWHCICVVQTMLFVICGTTYAMPQISFGGFGWAYCCDFSLVWDMPISGGRLRSDWTGLVESSQPVEPVAPCAPSSGCFMPGPLSG